MKTYLSFLISMILSGSLYGEGTNKDECITILSNLATSIWSGGDYESFQITALETRIPKSRTSIEVEKKLGADYDELLSMNKEVIQERYPTKNDYINSLREYTADELNKMQKVQIEVITSDDNNSLKFTETYPASNDNPNGYRIIRGHVMMSTENYESYEIDESLKTAILSKQAWETPFYKSLGCFSENEKLLLKSVLGEHEGDMFKRSDEKIAKVCSGGGDDAQLIANNIQWHNIEAVDISLILPNRNFPSHRWVCDRKDLNVVYDNESLDPESGEPVKVTTCEDFRQIPGSDRKYPFKISCLKYGDLAPLEPEKIEITVQNINIAKPEPSVFLYEIPEGFSVQDNRI